MPPHGFLGRILVPHWMYLGGQALTMDGTSQQAVLPSEATIVEIRAETADIYFGINAPIANVTSPGYVPANGGEIIGPLSNLNALTLYGTAAGAGVAHIMYFTER